MKTRTIRVKLNARSIDAAIKQLEDYKKFIQNRVIHLIEQMCRDGEDYAAAGMTHYATGITSGSIIGFRDGNRGVIEAGGAAIWIEFGTGVVKNPGEDPYHDRAELSAQGTTIYEWGEYGEGHGADPGGWYYLHDDGHVYHTYGIPMQPFMHNAAEKLAAEFEATAKKVFNR